LELVVMAKILDMRWKFVAVKRLKMLREIDDTTFSWNAYG